MIVHVSPLFITIVVIIVVIVVIIVIIVVIVVIIVIIVVIIIIVIIVIGVVQCTSISGIKDMYIVPLQYDDPPPPQLFPFDGPGRYTHTVQIQCT